MDGLITAILSNSLEICVWTLEDHFNGFDFSYQVDDFDSFGLVYFL